MNLSNRHNTHVYLLIRNMRQQQVNESMEEAIIICIWKLEKWMLRTNKKKTYA